MTESESIFAKLKEAQAAYLKTLEAADAEERLNPSKSYWDFQLWKTGRYCSVYQWHDIQESANAAFAQRILSMNQDITKPSAYSNDLTCQKALAKLTARFGGEVDPALLTRAVVENWGAFQKDLRACYADSGSLIKSGWVPWQLIVCAQWARPLQLPSVKWPFCFWSDKALVSFFKILGQDWDIDWSDFTLDKWRKFKRSHHLLRPDYIIVRGIKQVKNHKGELIEYDLEFKRCPSDNRVVAYRAEGGEQSTG